MSGLAETKSSSGSYQAALSQAATRAIGGLRYDWLMSLVGLIFVAGLYLDGWAHNHGRVDDSFFTPWHGFFYGSFAFMSCLLLATISINRWRRYPWRRVMPLGYTLSLLGMLIFAAGGIGDLIWHELFGVEKGIEALLSPTHLALAVGVALMIGGPLRAAWQRSSRYPTWRNLTPALLALSALISIFTFMMMFTHPIAYSLGGARHLDAGREAGQVAGVLGLLTTALLVCGPTMLVMRRWRLPAGSLMLVWGLNLAAMVIVNYQGRLMLYQAGVMLAGIVLIDLLRTRLQPSLHNRGGWRVFALLAPTLYIGSYILALLLTEGSRWSVHLLSGAVFLAGISGWLLSYLLMPPRMPAE